MKILTVCGTRPELIRLSVIIRKLDELVDHYLVFTNQNFDYNLSGKFFDELNIRKPNFFFNKKANSFGDFLGNAIVEFEKVLLEVKPDKILVLGDTNSGLLAIVANRHKIPIVHMEAGNRARDSRVPEEINRRIIDHVSTYNLPYTENSKQNLINEGFNKNYVYKTGNPLFEVLSYYAPQIAESSVLDKFRFATGDYTLVTVHRAENVDDVASLSSIVSFINTIAERCNIVVSLHPRTYDRMKHFDFSFDSENIYFTAPLGLFDFVKLEQNAKVVISDSGSVPEECCIFNVPSIIIRESTERHEIIECGASVLTGTSYYAMIDSFNLALKKDTSWTPPADYIVPNVSDIVINILIGK